MYSSVWNVILSTSSYISGGLLSISLHLCPTNNLQQVGTDKNSAGS